MMIDATGSRVMNGEATVMSCAGLYYVRLGREGGQKQKGGRNRSRDRHDSGQTSNREAKR